MFVYFEVRDMFLESFKHDLADWLGFFGISAIKFLHYVLQVVGQRPDDSSISASVLLLLGH